MSQAIQISAYNLRRDYAETQRLFVKVQGGRIEGRTATHFVCLLDVSGSMETEGRLRNCVDSLKYVARFLTADDRFSLITFSDNAEVRCDCVQMNEAGQAQVLHVLDQVRPLSSTNMSAALERLSGVVRGCAERYPTLKQGVLLLTDGFVNMGLVNEDGLIGLVHNFMTEFPRATVTGIGYGVDHNRDLLNAITTRAAGTYNIVRDREDVASVFGAVMGSMVSCVGLNLRVLVPRGTTIREERHREDVEETLTAIGLGDVYAETSSSILLTLPSGPLDLTHARFQVYDVTSGGARDSSVEIVPATPEIETEASIYTLRQDVAGLLKIIGTTTADQIPTLLEKANLYDGEIDGLMTRLGDENAILRILKEEIREVRAVLERIRTRPAYEATVDLSILGQHARYLSQGSGTRATSGGIVLSQAVTQDPFMTPLARHVSGGAAMTMASHEDSTEDPAFSTGNLAPVPLLRTPPRQYTGGAVMPSLPPMPARPLRSMRSIIGTPPSPIPEYEIPTFLSNTPVRYASFEDLINNMSEGTRVLTGGVAYPLPPTMRQPEPDA
jgi:hypothetical protein